MMPTLPNPTKRSMQGLFSFSVMFALMISSCHQSEATASSANKLATLQAQDALMANRHPFWPPARTRHLNRLLNTKGDIVLPNLPKTATLNNNKLCRGTWFGHRTPISTEQCPTNTQKDTTTTATVASSVAQPQHPALIQLENTTTKTKKKKKTLLAGLTKSFSDHLLIHGGHDIHTPRLLKACKHLERVMRRVGQRANANELLSNIRKVEVVYKKAPPEQRDTIRQLLTYEKSLGIHQPEGVIKDPSAAVGLLWLRRSLEFQYQLYKLVSTPLSKQKDPKVVAFAKKSTRSSSSKYMDATDASLLAYSRTLEHNHGWKIKNVYTLALRTSTPPRNEMLSALGGFITKARGSDANPDHNDDNNGDDSNGDSELPPPPSIVLGPQEEKIIERDMKQLLGTWKPLMKQWKATFAELDLEDKRRV